MRLPSPRSLVTPPSGHLWSTRKPHETPEAQGLLGTLEFPRKALAFWKTLGPPKNPEGLLKAFQKAFISLLQAFDKPIKGLLKTFRKSFKGPQQTRSQGHHRPPRAS